MESQILMFLIFKLLSSSWISPSHPGDAFLEELWQGMVRAGWPGRRLAEDEDPEVAPTDFVVMDPELVTRKKNWVFLGKPWGS